MPVGENFLFHYAATCEFWDFFDSGAHGFFFFKILHARNGQRKGALGERRIRFVMYFNTLSSRSDKQKIL